MIILSPNDPWPQVYFRRYKYTSASFGYWEEGHEDDSIKNLVMGAKYKIMAKNYDGPTTLFAGPRAANKISNYIAENLFSKFTTKEFSKNQKREFLGMELIFTLDDGLWIA